MKRGASNEKNKTKKQSNVLTVSKLDLLYVKKNEKKKLTVSKQT